MLKAEKIDLALLEAKYGFVTPQKVLQALQRDAIQDKADIFQDDIYERPMVEVTSTLNHTETHNCCCDRPALESRRVSPVCSPHSSISWSRSRRRRTGGCWSSC